MKKCELEMKFDRAWGEYMFQIKNYPFETDGEGWEQTIPIDEEYSLWRCDDPSFSVNRDHGLRYAYLGHLCLSERPNYQLFKDRYLSEHGFD